MKLGSQCQLDLEEQGAAGRRFLSGTLFNKRRGYDSVGRGRSVSWLLDNELPSQATPMLALDQAGDLMLDLT